jgi:hypothetical protein
MEKTKESYVHDTSGGEMPDPDAVKKTDSEEDIRKAFDDNEKQKQQNKTK